MRKEAFIQALEQNCLPQMQTIPKADVHSHAGRGGALSYIEQWAHVTIPPPSEPFDSLQAMNDWLRDHVKCHCPGIEGYLKRVEAAFAQAGADTIQVLALSYAVDEVDAFGGVQNFSMRMDALHRAFAPQTQFFPDLALGYLPAEEGRVEEIFAAGWFRGIDICNYAGRYTLKELKRICEKARAAGLLLKAHVGEFGGAEDVMRYAEELELDEIQHGIAAAESPQIMKWLADHKIRLNLCPTSNVMLKNCAGYESHPIRRLFDHGVAVTVNTDDLMIFNATASQEYINLYCAGLMGAEDLNLIRQTGLHHQYRVS